MTARCRARSGPGGRLRGAVRPADRPPGPRGPGLLRDRAAPRCRWRRCWPEPEGDRSSPAGRRRCTPRARRRHRPGLFTAGTPVFGMCYGFQLMAQGLGGEVAHTGAREYGRTPVTVTEPGTLLADIPPQHTVWMSHGDSVTAAPDGLRRARLDRRHAGRGVRGRRPRPGRRAVAPRGAAHRARPEGARALPGPHRPLPPDLDDGQHRRGADREDPRPDRRPRPGDLRPLRRRRLGRRRGDRAARDRRPADLRVRRPRADAPGRDRAGRARLRRRHRRRAQGRRRREAVPRRARRGHRPRGEAQDHRPRVHPGLRGRRGRGPRRRGDRRRRRQGRVPRPGHALPRRRRVRRGSGHLQHQVPPQRRRPARRPRVRAGRAAAHALQGRGPPGRRAARPARRDRLAPARSPAPASASGSSARSPASASTSCARPTPSPARS